MDLNTLLTKVHLGGLINICVIQDDGVVAMADEANMVLAYVKPNSRPAELKGVKQPLGIRDIGMFMRFLSFGGGEFEVVKNEIIVQGKKTGTRVSFKLADVSAIPAVEKPDSIIKQLKSNLSVTAVITADNLANLSSIQSIIKPDIITIKTVKGTRGTRMLKAHLGEDIGHTGDTIISTKITGSNPIDTVFMSGNLMAAIGVITSETITIYLGKDKPLMIEEKLDDATCYWAVSPYDIVAE